MNSHLRLRNQNITIIRLIMNIVDLHAILCNNQSETIIPRNLVQNQFIVVFQNQFRVQKLVELSQ